MTNTQPDESRGIEHLPQDEQEATPGDRSSLNAAHPETGSNSETDRETGQQSSGKMPFTEGAANQSTEQF